MLVASMRDRLGVAGSHLSDLYLTIDAQGCGTFDWDAAQRMADLGYVREALGVCRRPRGATDPSIHGVTSQTAGTRLQFHRITLQDEVTN
jgi:hypothetical protein